MNSKLADARSHLKYATQGRGAACCLAREHPEVPDSQAGIPSPLPAIYAGIFLPTTGRNAGR